MNDLDDAYDRGWDEGRADIWEELVCSVCGMNHDRDESAGCEGANTITFHDWVGRVSEFIVDAHNFGRSVGV